MVFILFNLSGLAILNPVVLLLDKDNAGDGLAVLITLFCGVNEDCEVGGSAAPELSKGEFGAFVVIPRPPFPSFLFLLTISLRYFLFLFRKEEEMPETRHQRPAKRRSDNSSSGF